MATSLMRGILWGSVGVDLSAFSSRYETIFDDRLVLAHFWPIRAFHPWLVQTVHLAGQSHMHTQHYHSSTIALDASSLSIPDTLGLWQMFKSILNNFKMFSLNSVLSSLSGLAFPLIHKPETGLGVNWEGGFDNLIFWSLSRINSCCWIQVIVFK